MERAQRPTPVDSLRAPEGEPAYFVKDGALVQLDANGFDTLTVDEPIDSLQLSQDGKLHAIGFDAVLALESGELRPITARANEGIQDVYVVDHTDIWATRMAELVHWDGKEWRHEPLAPIDALQTDFEIERSPTGVVVDRQSRVWLTTARDVMMKDARGWHTLGRARLGGAPQDLWLDRDGVARLQLASYRFVRLSDDPSAAPTRSAAPPGTVWLEQHGDTWSIVHSDSRGRLYARELQRVLEAPMAFGYAADARDRLWVSTAAGVTIFGTGAITKWPMGTVAELDGRVEHIIVLGRGPDALPAAGPQRTGGMRARLMKDGSPVVGARVQVCTQPLAVTLPPCAESRPSFVATSDADGRFVVSDLPVGVWGIAVQIGGQWRLLNRGLDPFRVAAGDATDFGELDATRGMVVYEELVRRRSR